MSPRVPIALVEPRYDRMAEHRTDQVWLDAAWTRPDTRVLLLSDAKVLAPNHHVSWLRVEELSVEQASGQRVLLGVDDLGAARFAMLLPEVTEAAEAPRLWASLRGMLTHLGEDEAAYVVHAVGIAEWQAANRHCARCGGSLSPTHSGHVLHCNSCARDQFPRTDPAVIMVVVEGEGDDERCLLGRHPQWPPGRYSTLAGFVEPGESMEQAVRREVLEETGVRIGEVDYFGSQPWPLPASLMVGFIGHATSTDVRVDGEEIEDAQWFTRAQMRERAESGELVLPGGISISRSLVEWWYGEELPGHW